MKTVIACLITATIVFTVTTAWNPVGKKEFDGSGGERDTATKLGEGMFRIYGVNSWSYESEVDFYITLDDTLSLPEKVEAIASKLSRTRFCNLPIQVLRIEDRPEGSVAVVDLKERKGSCARWAGGYFEGSTGGRVTSGILIESFLQREYMGGWIDGVEFLYEGSEDIRSFDHIKPLYRTVYRQGAH
ncbi:MAG: hypothetical protein AB1483_09750 [Candidatus Zixiibacteriota bacterium]